MRYFILTIIFLSAINIFGQTDGAISLEQIKSLPNTTQSIDNLCSLTEQLSSNNPIIALKYAEEAYLRSQKLKYKTGEADALHQIALAYDNQSKYDEALTYYFKSRSIKETLNDKISLSSTLTNIGLIYQIIGNYDEAQDFLTKALEYREASQNKLLVANSINNLASLYTVQEKNDPALNYFRQALRLYKEIDDKPGIAMAYNNLAGLYAEINIDSTHRYFNLALNLYKDLADIRNIANLYFNLAYLYESNNTVMKLYLDSCLAVTKKINNFTLFSRIYEAYSEIYEDNEPVKSLEYFKLYKLYEDSIFNTESQKRIDELQMIYDTEAKQREISEQKASIERHELLRNSLIVVVVLILALAALIYYSYKTKMKDNKLLTEQNIEIAKQRDEITDQRDEITAQRDEIDKQKQKVEHINKEMTDSIRYASKIQSAMLPRKEMLSNYMSDIFILYMPRDIVSGDFYWWTIKDDFLFIAVADCTGHGVPGSMLSMLGISLLDEIVNKSNEYQPNKILNNLREQLILALHQTGSDNETRDGMDISLCMINIKSHVLYFSAAYNVGYLIRKNTTEIEELKADRMPIGIHVKKDSLFTITETTIDKGDTLYLLSDGLVDQFDNEDKSKFTRKRFKELILDINTLPMNRQNNMIRQRFTEWKGKTPQVDDVTVLGFRI